jgi:hypothetical protein
MDRKPRIFANPHESDAVLRVHTGGRLLRTLSLPPYAPVRGCRPTLVEFAPLNSARFFPQNPNSTFNLSNFPGSGQILVQDLGNSPTTTSLTHRLYKFLRGTLQANTKTK